MTRPPAHMVGDGGSARDFPTAGSPDLATFGHTPGPWSHRSGGVFAPDGFLLAALGDDETPDNPADVQEANARLMAAAPEMLQALIDVRDGLGCQPGYVSTLAMQRAIAAIAKAVSQ